MNLNTLIWPMIFLSFTNVAKGHDEQNQNIPVFNSSSENMVGAFLLIEPYLNPNTRSTLKEDIQVAENRLEALFNREFSSELVYYTTDTSENGESNSAAAVLFSAEFNETETETETGHIPSLFSATLSYGHVFRYEKVFATSHLIALEESLPGSDQESRTTYRIEREFLTKTVDIPDSPDYIDIHTCLDRRMEAERYVSQDSNKKVFWSYCQKTGVGYSMVVAYVNANDIPVE